MCEKYERCQHTSSTRKFKKIERGVKLCAGRNTTCLATAQQAVCILLAARSCCGHATLTAADPGFPEGEGGGAPTPKVGVLAYYFAENYIK